MKKLLTLAFSAALWSGAASAQCVGGLQAANNLSDVCAASTARSNLGTNDAANITTGSLGTARLSTSIQAGGWSFVIDGAGSAISTGIKGDVEVPYACTITAARMFADQTGSIVVDLWKDTYANYPPTDADSITSSTPPTISSATKSEDTTLTSWTTSVAAGNIIRYNVDSATTVTRVTVSITCAKS